MSSFKPPKIKIIPIRMLGDSDKDTVPDYRDCEPFNAKKQDNDEYFFHEGEMYLYDPEGYAKERYGISRSDLLSETLSYARDEKGRPGVKKSQIDMLGRYRR